MSLRTRKLIVHGRPITTDMRRLFALVLPHGAVITGIIDKMIHYTDADGRQMACAMTTTDHVEL